MPLERYVSAANEIISGKRFISFSGSGVELRQRNPVVSQLILFPDILFAEVTVDSTFNCYGNAVWRVLNGDILQLAVCDQKFTRLIKSVEYL